MLIKKLRQEKGFSQEQLAGITNLSTRTIQRIEKSDSGSLESLSAIALVFDLSYSELQEKIKNSSIIDEEKNLESNILKDKKIIIFVLVNSLLFLINIITSPNTIWFIYPLLGWGIPLFYKRYKAKILNS